MTLGSFYFLYYFRGLLARPISVIMGDTVHTVDMQESIQAMEQDLQPIT